MFLIRKHNVRTWNHEEKEYRVTATLNNNPLLMIGSRGAVTTISEEVKYWRKSNAIHKWFVDNVQDGVDDCGRYEVSLSQLTELKDICIRLMKSPEDSKELLPTTEGFFFGSDDYGDWYFEDLMNTAAIIVQLERDHKKAKELGHSMYYEYTSSW